MIIPILIIIFVITLLIWAIAYYKKDDKRTDFFEGFEDSDFEDYID